MTDIIIVGAGTAGLTAAIYAARAGKSVLMFEGESFGGQITFSPRVENYPGIPSVSGNEFAANLVEQVLDLGVETEPESVAEIRKTSDGFAVLAGGSEYSARAVILATGVKHRPLGLPNEEELIGGGVSYCAVCDGAFFKGKKTAVVGGGNTALQDALFLADLCSEVTLIHRREEFRAEERLVNALAGKPNIRLLLNSVVTELVGESELTAIVTGNTLTHEKTELAIDGLFVAVGQLPQNEAFRGLVDLDEGGYITAGENCHTSTAGIFAAGDCRTKEVRQLTTAAADGAIAAVEACKYIQ